MQQAASERLLLQYTTSTFSCTHSGTQASTVDERLSAASQHHPHTINLFFCRPCVAHDETGLDAAHLAPDQMNRAQKKEGLYSSVNGSVWCNMMRRNY